MDLLTSRRILLLNGPNVAIVGWRLPEHYGSEDIHTFTSDLADRALARGIELDAVFSNHEGVLIDALNAWGPPSGRREAIIVNPGGLTAFGVGLRSAILASGRYTVEVHISNKYSRESEGHHHLRDVVAPVTAAQIVGLGLYGYDVALSACARYFDSFDEPSGVA